MKVCPICNNYVEDSVTVCPHCKVLLSNQPGPTDSPTNTYSGNSYNSDSSYSTRTYSENEYGNVQYQAFDDVKDFTASSNYSNGSTYASPEPVKKRSPLVFILAGVIAAVLAAVLITTLGGKKEPYEEAIEEFIVAWGKADFNTIFDYEYPLDVRDALVKAGGYSNFNDMALKTSKRIISTGGDQALFDVKEVEVTEFSELGADAIKSVQNEYKKSFSVTPKIDRIYSAIVYFKKKIGNSWTKKQIPIIIYYQGDRMYLDVTPASIYL